MRLPDADLSKRDEAPLSSVERGLDRDDTQNVYFHGEARQTSGGGVVGFRAGQVGPVRQAVRIGPLDWTVRSSGTRPTESDTW